MTQSPFEFAANATLVFEVPTDEFEYNELGNPIVIKKNLIIKALLKVVDKKENKRDGVNNYDFNLEGFLVDPVDFPPEIKAGMKAEASIELSPNLISNGFFELKPFATNPFLIATNIKGLTKIKGYFKYPSILVKNNPN